MFTEILVEVSKLALLLAIFIVAFGLGFHILLSKNEKVPLGKKILQQKELYIFKSLENI